MKRHSEGLDFDEIKRTVGSLTDRTLKTLAEGPLPEMEGRDWKETCRICEVLEKLKSNAGAVALMEWHDLVGRGYSLIGAVVHEDLKDDIERGLTEEIGMAMGDLSYARCIAVYFAARAELEERRRGYIEEGLDIDGEPPDERDAGERRQDDEADAAEARMDWEKAEQ